MGMIMQINVDLQISTEMEICPSMALDVWQVKKKLDDTQSSITKCVILAIHVNKWIRSTYQKVYFGRISMRTSKYKKNVGMIQWPKRGSTRGSW